MTTKVIRLDEKLINQLQVINKDLNMAVTELLQKCNKSVTNDQKTVTDVLQPVTDCYSKEDIDQLLTKQNNQIQSLIRLKIDEIDQNILNLIKRNQLK